MKNILLMILRIFALFITFTILFVFASNVTTPPELAQNFTQEQLSQSAVILPLVSLIMTLMLAYLALRSRWLGWKLAGALFLLFYGIYTFLSQIETAVFPAVANQLLPGMLGGFFLAGLILAAPLSLLAVWILGKAKKEPAVNQPNNRLALPASEWAWKIAVAVLLYVAVYFIFGYYIAWRTPGLPEFYGSTDPGTFWGQVSNVVRDTPWLPFFQGFRALVWIGIGCIIIRMHKGNGLETSLAVGLAFSVLMAAPLLFPNPFMPPEITRAHFIELISSNFLYGCLLSALVLWRPKAVSSLRPAPFMAKSGEESQ